ncbi:MAG: hypothetical protein M3N18_10910, partial [Actinomycetota bacterium]|nr:hypothetical protein [Actinomycetota bacterium]
LALACLFPQRPATRIATHEPGGARYRSVYEVVGPRYFEELVARLERLSPVASGCQAAPSVADQQRITAAIERRDAAASDIMPQRIYGPLSRRRSV